jgi:arabinogalactan endo-1,4-beta-galactosidase
MSEKDGWTYDTSNITGDARKLVTLEQQGMDWVGIRLWNSQDSRWMNASGIGPELANVKAWRDLPQPAQGWHARGILHIPNIEE